MHRSAFAHNRRKEAINWTVSNLSYWYDSEEKENTPNGWECVNSTGGYILVDRLMENLPIGRFLYLQSKKPKGH